jgi:hypothetical protein
MWLSRSEAIRAVYLMIWMLHVIFKGGMLEMMSKLPIGNVLKQPVIHLTV